MKEDIQPCSLLLYTTWDAAIKVAPVLEELENALMEQSHPPPTIFRMQSHHLGPFVPKSFAHEPIAYIRLPESLRSEFIEFAQVTIDAINYSSGDLLQNETYLLLESRAGTLAFRSGRFDDELNAAHRAGALLILYRCSSQVILTSVIVDDDVIIGLSAQHSCSGMNYKPYQRLPEEWLAEAAGGEPEIGLPESDKRGKPFVQLMELRSRSTMVASEGI